LTNMKFLQQQTAAKKSKRMVKTLLHSEVHGLHQEEMFSPKKGEALKKTSHCKPAPLSPDS